MLARVGNHVWKSLPHVSPARGQQSRTTAKLCNIQMRNVRECLSRHHLTMQLNTILAWIADRVGKPAKLPSEEKVHRTEGNQGKKLKESGSGVEHGGPTVDPTSISKVGHLA